MTFKKHAFCENCCESFPVKKEQYLYSKQLEFNPQKKGKFNVLYEEWDLLCPECHKIVDRIVVAG